MSSTAMHDDEYATIAEMEGRHWWYRSLHEQVLSVIENNFNNKGISIIDAGCGTGGLMDFLIRKGYRNVKGFDISEIAVRFCHNKGLNVFIGNLDEIGSYFAPHEADVVISNDTFYFLDDEGQRKATDTIYNLLAKNGLLILNIPSLEAFRGIHDIRVGINRRFNRKNTWKLLDVNKYALVKESYWPFVLSPAIWLTRYAQRLKMKFNKTAPVNSDLKNGNRLAGNLFAGLIHLENRLLKRKPFGSSLFLVARVKHS